MIRLSLLQTYKPSGMESKIISANDSLPFNICHPSSHTIENLTIPVARRLNVVYDCLTVRLLTPAKPCPNWQSGYCILRESSVTGANNFNPKPALANDMPWDLSKTGEADSTIVLEFVLQLTLLTGAIRV